MSPNAPPFDERAFITSMILSSIGEADLAALAIGRGQSAETRELGAAIHRTAGEMRDDLTRIARQRNLPVPNGTQEVKVALKENLQTLESDGFDRAYAMAAVQDLNAMLRNFNAAATSNDPEVRQFALKYRSSILDHQRTANRLFGRLGGSPWPGVSP